MNEFQDAAPEKPAPSFRFTDVFWEKTAMLFGFYWLFRWLCPSLLPEGLQTASFQTQMFVCATGGLVFTILAALGHTRASSPQADPNRESGQSH